MKPMRRNAEYVCRTVAERMSALYTRARKLGLPKPTVPPLEDYEKQVIARLDARRTSRR
jgi:hypothetical protein